MIVEVVVPMVASMVVSDVSDRIPILGVLGALLLEGGPNQIVWFAAFFFLWVILTVWCCLVIHGDQRREEIEQLINTIKVDSGKSLHQETQQANEYNDTKQSVSETAKANSNETNTTRIFICVVIFFLAIILLAVFLRKGGYQLSNNQRIDAKNPSHENYKKNDNNRSKPLNP
ncbi:hypothetical protein NP0154_01660 [Helicobacter pylori]